MSDSQSLCVLVAEDDVALREAMVDVLRDAGHVVDQASNGAVALEKALLRVPDVAVIDFKMPVADGAALVESIRSIIRPRPALVVISGSPNAARWCTEHGVDIFHAKPFSLDAFLHTVAHAGRQSVETRPSSSFMLSPVRSACVMAVADASYELKAALPGALHHARVVVVDTVDEALDILGSISPELVVLSDAIELSGLREYVQARGIPCLVRSRHELDPLR